ncbi:MAG: ADP-ribosylglycohydrolase family protein [Desulfovibrionaceae bacterium]|nr:ADP-ribosylglycohydrolase family protein [Desulfovibrionaceae bacterium]
MLGAMLGDIIGSVYEFTQNNIKTTDFPLFSEKSRFTDDTVMTAAVAEALLNAGRDEEKAKTELVARMREYGRMFPFAGYGQKFFLWLGAREPQKPYNSYGNGSAMRVSPVAWLFDELEEVERFAAVSAAVTHNHPEGIKGAQAAAAAIFLARRDKGKAAIKNYIEEHYGYDLSRTPEDIRPGYIHVVTCQETVPEAIIAFLHGHDFESAVRVAVSLGGDSDTLAAITGSIAEAAWGIPEELKQEALPRLDERLLAVYRRFEAEMQRRHAHA